MRKFNSGEPDAVGCVRGHDVDDLLLHFRVELVPPGTNSEKEKNCNAKKVKLLAQESCTANFVKAG